MERLWKGPSPAYSTWRNTTGLSSTSVVRARKARAALTFSYPLNSLSAKRSAPMPPPKPADGRNPPPSTSRWCSVKPPERQSVQRLQAYPVLNRKAVREHKSASGPAEPIELPAGAVNLLMQILEAIAAGRGAAVIPENTELTTLQAAEALSVSRPFLIKLLEEKKIPYRHPHRRYYCLPVVIRTK